MNQTIDINVRQYGEQKGRNFIIGVVVMLVILRLWWKGYVLNALDFATAGPDENFGSVTGVVLPIVVEVLMGVGSIATMLGLGVWYVIWDFCSGVYEWIVSMRVKAIAQAAAQNAVAESANAAITRAMSNQVVTESGKTIGIAEVARAVQTISDRLNDLSDRVDRLPTTKPVSARSRQKTKADTSE